MSKHYLLDIHTTDPAHGRLKELCIPNGGSTYIDGSYVVRVPDDVTISDTVSNATDLLAEKYAGILANSGLFTHIVYDDMLDPNGVNLANSVGIAVGMRNVCSIFPSSFWGTPGYPTSTLQMNMVSLGATTPTQCTVYWEVFTYGSWDVSHLPPFHAYRRYYYEEAESAIGCEVSFNNGVSWNSVTYGELFNIPVGDQGTQFIIRFVQGGTQARYYLGSWAVLY